MNAPTFMLEKPSADYTMVCNAVLRDRSISLRAKGLYALMFSKPSGWVFHENVLLAESSEGRDALRSAMKELLSSRWVEKCQPREGGKFAGVTFRMHLTVDWKTVDGSTVAGKSTSNNTDYTKTDKPSPQPPKGESDGFQEIWKAVWGRGTSTHGKQKALKAYAAALKRGHKHEDLLAAVKARAGIDADKLDSPYAPMLSTWLNESRWEDGDPTVARTADEIAAAEERLKASAAEHAQKMRRLAEERSNQLLGKTA